MPWKDGYTISDERSLTDAEVHWPDGHRCCFSITVDLSVASGPDGISEADLASPKARFGLNEGFDRVMGALDRFGLKVTFATPALMARVQAHRLRVLTQEGHEIAAHGFRHEDVSSLSRAEEAARIDLTTSVLSEITGRRPMGWFSLPRPADPFAGGTISADTMDLLIDAGYSYFGNGLADDIPHYWVTDAASRRAILTMPYYYHYDDQFFLLFPAKGTGLEHADSLFRNWRAEFDAQYRRGRHFHMTLHPYAVGFGHRLRMLETFLQYASGFPGLWKATAGAVISHWRATYAAEVYPKLQPGIWRDWPGSLS
jgi:peptidoglycan/xylan/chitin deacetylase (PgdA/CDA1 family)